MKKYLLLAALVAVTVVAALFVGEGPVWPIPQ